MGLSVTAKVDSLIAKFDLFYNTVIDSEVSKCQAAVERTLQPEAASSWTIRQG